MSMLRKLGIVVAAGALLGAACGDENNPSTPNSDVNYNRTYIQIDRLGNPLVSEVFLEKRTHGAFNAVGPDQDEALFTTEFKFFIGNTAGRPADVQNLLAGVLLPDELIVDTTKAAATAGWLSWALGMPAGYGGRRLTDDVVDAGLGVLFTTACLQTDNVDENDVGFSTSFPYLGAPH